MQNLHVDISEWSLNEQSKKSGIKLSMVTVKAKFNELRIETTAK